MGLSVPVLSGFACNDVQLGQVHKKNSAELHQLELAKKKPPQSRAGLHSITEKTPRSCAKLMERDGACRFPGCHESRYVEAQRLLRHPQGQ